MSAGGNDAEALAAVRAAIRTKALDRFTSDYLAEDARDWIAGFASRAAMDAILAAGYQPAARAADEAETAEKCRWGQAGAPACRAGTRGLRYWCDVCAAALLPCGHTELTPGCGGCDPGATEFVITDNGERRPYDPALDLTQPPRRADADRGGSDG